MSADQATIECAGCRKPTPIIEDGVDHICPECEILALKRKLAEQQALIKRIGGECVPDSLLGEVSFEELNNLLANAKEEGRKEGNTK